MKWVIQVIKTSIGAKLLVTLTGVGLTLFILGHIFGNLLIYAGSDALNIYAETLQGLGIWLWLVRFGLLSILLIHIFVALKLTYENWRARPVAYHKKAHLEATVASRTMWITGSLIFCFLIYHLLHFTFRWINGEQIIRHYDDFGRHDVYTMVVQGFHNPLNSVIYIIAMLIIVLHLGHGIQSMFQTLGINHPKYLPLIRIGGPVVAWLIALLAISMPVLVLLGFITLNGGAL